MVTSAHDVADARLHRTVAALRSAGLTVELLGVGDPAAAPPGLARLTARSRLGLAGRLLRAAALPFQGRGRVLLVLDPDVVPAANLRRALGRLPGLPPRRVVVDVYEDYGAVLADRVWVRGRVTRLAAVGVAVAERLSRRADLTVVADAHVPPADAVDRLVVRNLPLTGEAGYLPAPGPRDAEPRAVYVGDLRASRGLFTMVEAVAAAPPWRLDLVGPVAAADAEALQARLAQLDVADRVTLTGRRPPEQAWQVARGAWVGLCLLHDTPAYRAAVPSKLYEYLASGLAVVASDLPRQAAMVEAADAGVVVPPRDAAAAAGALRALAAEPATVDRYRVAAAAWAAEHLPGPSEYDELARRVVRLVRGG